MDKTKAGIVGALAGFAAMGTAHAASQPAQTAEQTMRVSSYAELLNPIPNARALLNVETTKPPLETVQYYQDGPPPGYHHHHHHHHHHHYYPPPHHHHHHHHHQSGLTVVIPGVGVVRN